MNRTASLLIIALFTSACGSRNPKGTDLAKPVSAAGLKPIEVSVLEVKPSAAKAVPSIPAVLSVEHTAVILAQRDGIVTGLHAEEGMRVAKGQVMAQLDDRDLRIQLREATLEVSRLLVEEQQYQAQAQLNRSELDQNRTLFKEGLTSQRQLDRAQAQLDVSLQEAEKSRLNTRIARAKVDAVQAEIDKTLVCAPFDGVIIHRQISLGANAVRNEKLFELAQSGPLQVKFQSAPSRRIGEIELLLPDGDRVVARARIQRVTPVADVASNTLGYVAEVIGGAGLIPGMAVNVRFPGAAVGVTVWLPRMAFSAVADSTGSLFVIDGERCTARTVSIRSIDGDQVEVRSGLAAGDLVIFAPPASLKSGDAITIRP
jgi:membrane fusion protein, multidrug efflux system